jgi:Flp pilus assembly protein TadD
MPHVYRVIALELIAITVVLAQNIGLGPGNPAAGPGMASATPAPQPTGGQSVEARLPVFLSGTVMFAGGAGPADNVPIQRVCGGATRTVAFTNNKGQFSFQWGGSNSLFPDAGDPGPANSRRTGDLSGDTYRGGSALGMSVMLGCELIAGAPGYEPASVDLSGHRAGDNSDVGMMVLHRLASVEGTSVSFTSLNAPKDARRAWEKGVRLLRSPHPSDVAAAEKELEKAVAVYPKFANAWADLGRARLHRQETDEARDAFLKAIDADDKLVQPYIELGNIAVHRMQWTDAARYLDRALTLDPVDYPRLWLADGLADYRVNNFDRAERNAREALKISAPNQDPEASRLLGYVLMQKQDYAGADEAFRAYLRLVPNANDLRDIKARLGQIADHLP